MYARPSQRPPVRRPPAPGVRRAGSSVSVQYGRTYQESQRKPLAAVTRSGGISSVTFWRDSRGRIPALPGWTPAAGIKPGHRGNLVSA